MNEQCTGRSGQSYGSRLDSGIRLDRDIDQPPLLVCKSTHLRVQGLRLIIDCAPAGTSKGQYGVGNSVVEATVESAKLVAGNESILFDGQVCDGLADVPIFVDNLVDAVSQA